MNADYKFRLISIIAAFSLAFVCFTAALPLAAADSTSAALTETAADAPAASPTEVPSISFPDVYEHDWFYSDVMRLVSERIINGYPDGLFHPEREITNAEFIKILMISAGADLSVIPESVLFPDNWASLYISHAYASGIITDADLAAGFLPDTPITRSAMTKMMILALGIEPARIDDPFTDISDIYASTAYNEYLLRGYLMEDDTRVYNGNSNAMRSEAAAIAVRIMNYRENSYEYKKAAILENASQNPLNNEFELLDLFYIINREFMTEFTFESTVPLDTCMEYYFHANVIHLEYFYSSNTYFKHYTNVNRYELTLEYAPDIETQKQYHSAAVEKADKIIASIITEGMSGLEKIKAIHDYLILNCAYDYDSYIAGSISPESRLSYGALCNQSAVCQGYAAAFNLLCDRVGIRSVGVSGFAPGSEDEHAWNMLLLDGQIYYIDVTHDDPVPDQKGRISYKYYYLTEAEMTRLGYTWDKNQSNLKYLY